MLTTILDIAGLVCLAVFAWFIWPALPLFVVGAGCLLASRKATK